MESKQGNLTFTLGICNCLSSEGGLVLGVLSHSYRPGAIAGSTVTGSSASLDGCSSSSNLVRSKSGMFTGCDGCQGQRMNDTINMQTIKSESDLTHVHALDIT